jgi:methylase of polypeptide subunit release factors
MELGIHESEAVSALLSASGYHHIEIRKDLAGIDRMILGKRPDGEKQ